MGVGVVGVAWGMAKIPAEARCVFRGVIFDVYQWEQVLFDGSVATFECAKRPDTVVVLAVMPDGRICYSEQEQPGKPPFVGLLGGRSEPGEDPLTVAKRELLEESGLVSNDWRPFRTYRPGGSKLDWNVHYWIARNCRTVAAQQLDAGEKVTLRTTDVATFVRDIVTSPHFAEQELQREVLGALDEDRAAALMAALGE